VPTSDRSRQRTEPAKAAASESAADAVARARSHAQSAIAEALAAVRALLDASSLALSGKASANSALLGPIARLLEGLAAEFDGAAANAEASALLGSIALGFSNVGPLVESGWLLIVAGLAFLPIAIGIAIFRYRLYDIDRIVSRAIGYLIVTGVLAAVFVGAVLAFSAFLAPVLGENPVAVAASTLVVAALFQPLRARVQRVVDRRFDRSRYDARLAAEAFADRLRDQVALDRIETDLIAAVDATLRPLAVGFWLTGDRRAGKSR